MPAEMAELADAHGSGPCEGSFMGVRIPLSAPMKKAPEQGAFFVGAKEGGIRTQKGMARGKEPPAEGLASHGPSRPKREAQGGRAPKGVLQNPFIRTKIKAP